MQCINVIHVLKTVLLHLFCIEQPVHQQSKKMKRKEKCTSVPLNDSSIYILFLFVCISLWTATFIRVAYAKCKNVKFCVPDGHKL